MKKATKAIKAATTPKYGDRGHILELGDVVQFEKVSGSGPSRYRVVGIALSKARLLSESDPANEISIEREIVKSRLAAQLGSNGAQELLNKRAESDEAKAQAAKARPAAAPVITPGPGGLANLATEVEARKKNSTDKAVDAAAKKRKPATILKKPATPTADVPKTSETQYVLRKQIVVTLADKIAGWKPAKKIKLPEKFKSPSFYPESLGYRVLYELVTTGKYTKPQVVATAMDYLSKNEDPMFEWEWETLWAMAAETAYIAKRLSLPGFAA